MPTFAGNEVIDKEKFDKVWHFLMEEFGGSDQDMLQAWTIVVAIEAILRKAFKLEQADVELEDEDGEVAG